MRVVTAGSAYIDIDAYAGCIAYAELLRLQGERAVAISTAPWNESISATVQSWGSAIVSRYNPKLEDTFTLIDVSDPEFFDPIVDPARVVEVIDHHVGFEKYWQDRIGSGTRIEFIGAAATLVFEHWQQEGKLAGMSQTAARLLLTAILDNTLNFGALPTTERDHQAYQTLLPISNLSAGWPQRYFQECEQSIVSNFETAIRNDTKTIQFAKLPGITALGQVMVWDGSAFLQEHGSALEKVLGAMGDQWFTNIIALGQKRSYLFAQDRAVQQTLEQILGIKFINNVAQADRLWLRKEILKASLFPRDMNRLAA